MRTTKTLRATPVISFYFSIFGILILSVISSMNVYAQQVARQVPTGYETKFWAYTPPSYSSAGAGHPVLIFLHGGSGIGDDLNILTQQITGSQNNGHLAPSRLIYNLEQNVANAKKWNASLPFVVISPQLKRDLSVPNYNDQQWPADLVNELIDYVIDQYNIDVQRIYLAGISLGGLGVWNYTSEYPHRPAAIVPMSSVTYPETACPVKNVPTWAFHGENDFQVDREFTIDMVEQVNSCPGNYTAHLTLLRDRYHEGWNELFTDDNGYRIYDWFLTFQKGDNSNKAPFVFCGKDVKTALRTEPFYITGEYFDIDGTIASVEWTQTAGPTSLILDQTNPKILKITNPGQVAGTYTFRLRATDNDSQSAEDFVEITFGNPTGPTITNIWLTDASQNNIRVLVEDDVIDLTALADRKINLRATYANANSVVWSINTEKTTRVRNTQNNQIAYIGDTSQDWEPENEEYVVCATPYSATDGNGTQGFSLCFKIRFSNTFYALHNSVVSQLTSWNTELDGSGVSPASFSASGYNYVIPSNRIAIVSSPWQIHQDSKVTVEGGATLRLQNNIQRTGGGAFGNIYADPNGTIHISASGYQQLAPLSLTSTTILESPATRIPNTRLGNVILRGNDAKHIQPARTVTIKGDLTIEASNLISGNTDYTSQLVLVGDLIIEPGGQYNPQRPLNVTFGSGTSNIVFNGTRMVFHSVSVENGGTLNIVKETAPTTPTILEVGANTTAGITGIFLEEGASLNLNGHTLNLRNGATINPQNQTGEIGLENSTLSIVTTAIGTSNLYPKRGDHALKTLEVNMPGGSTLNIRDSLNVVENIRIVGGEINSNSLVSLVSTPTFTAYVSPRPAGATGTINGNVNYQRSVEPGRKYKYLAFPVKNIQVADVQDYIPITGNFPESSTGDGMTANPSFFYYNGTLATPANIDLGWTEFPAASNTEPLVFGRGYSTFIRESDDHSKLILTGELQVGDFNYSSVLASNPTSNTNLGWNLVANPYASTISWNQGWTKTNVSTTVYVTDNRTETSNVWTWDGSTGDEQFGGVIASGQSFWVRTTTGSPSLIITEQAKLEQGDASFYRTGSDDVVSLRIQLKQNDRIDNAYLKFSNAGKVKFDDTQDGVKMKNSHFNLSILSSDLIPTAIKNLCDTLCSQEVGLAVEPKGAGTYALSTKGNAYDQMISSLYLVDNYIDSVFEWHEGKEYVFQVDENAKSFAQDRFKLIIEKSTMEQPTISWHEGALVSSLGKKVQWMLNGEDIPGATSASFYPTMEGDYTVRLTGKACSKVSPAYAFRITGTGNPILSEVKIYPNPVTNYIRVIGIDPAQSEVAYTITSLSGAVLQRGNVAYEDLSGEGEVKLKSMSAGLYILNVRGTSGAHQFKFSVR